MTPINNNLDTVNAAAAAIVTSVDTVNAAATAIVTADTRVQQTTLQKRRWGSCWSKFWCFGSQKHRKRISHAVIAPESTAPPGVSQSHVSEDSNNSTARVIPFIAPPSSPASFLQSGPPSSTQSPTGLLSLNSLSFNTYSPGGTASIFAIGPYAYETQLVSPPVFSTMNTEPSTASFTPPPESVQFTTPSSPEVPFAQLLTSSLASCQTNGGSNHNFPLSQYEFQPYQVVYPGSQGSSIPNSGTCSPFPEKSPIIEFRVGEVPKFLNYEYFNNSKWGSRLGSGSGTPNGWGSRMGSGSLTPNGLDSRVGSGSLTPTAFEPLSRDNFIIEAQISEMDLNTGSLNNDRHRVSFELSVEDVFVNSSLETCPVSTQDKANGNSNENNVLAKKTENHCEYCARESSKDMPQKELGEDKEKQCRCEHKDFNFSNTKGEVSNKPWLAPQKNWTFFPMLQPDIS